MAPSTYHTQRKNPSIIYLTNNEHNPSDLFILDDSMSTLVSALVAATATAPAATARGDSPVQRYPFGDQD